MLNNRPTSIFHKLWGGGGGRRWEANGGACRVGVTALAAHGKGLFFAVHVFELMFFLLSVKKQVARLLGVRLHNAPYLEADQTLGSAFPAWLFLLPLPRRAGGAGERDELRGAGSAAASRLRLW